MVKEEIALLQCELARDHLTDLGYIVTKGFISPVHDSYGKPGLAPITHRINMIKCALKSSNWIQLSSWESEQEGWTRTYDVIQHHQERLNHLANDLNINKKMNPRDLNENPIDLRIKVKLLCGSDIINSFSLPGVWTEIDLQRIFTDHGVVVITRIGYDLNKIIYDHDVLFSLRKHLIIVNEYVENGISSTKIRKALSRGQSIKYLVPDEVERYLQTHKLYDCGNSKYKKIDESIKIPAEIFNDYEKYSINNNKLTIANEQKNTNSKKERKRKIKEVTCRPTRKRSKRNRNSDL